LNPEICRDGFTLEEDLRILEFRLKIGNKWSEMVKALPGRTENRIKNRFNCMFKKAREEVVFKNKSYNMEEALS
jgi:myb proto-oncogene protein